MSSKRSVALMALLLVLLGAYLARPVWEPRLAGIPDADPPLAGTNSISGLTLVDLGDGAWAVDFDYFYTGEPRGAVLRASAEASGATPGGPGFTDSVVNARRGQQHVRMRLFRPRGSGSDALTSHQVVAELLDSRLVLAARQVVQQDIDWPDMNTWSMQQALVSDGRPFRPTVPDSDRYFEEVLAQTAGCSQAELEARQPCPDFNEQWLERNRTQQRFMLKAFDWLDRRYEHLCTGAERFTSGIWKLDDFAASLQGLFASRNQWAEDNKAIQDWKKVRPNSRVARLAEAEYWNAYAWQARGGGYARSVSEKSWQLFRERLRRSLALLEPMVDSADACPIWYSAMIYRLSDLGASEATLRAVYSKAARKFPEYHGIYFAMARHYEPRWGGSLEQYDAFAIEVVEATKAFEGSGLYARVYWLVDDRNATPYRAGASRFPVWEKLQRGYEDLLRFYPSSLHNLRKFTEVGCRSDDSALYRDLRTRTAPYEDTKRFPALPAPLESFDACDRRHHWSPSSSPARTG